MSKTTEGEWAYSQNEEAYHFDAATKEEAIRLGTSDFDGEPFWVCSFRRPKASEFVPDADSIIDTMMEHAYDEVGDFADDFPGVSKEAEAELEALLQSWADKHCSVSFWIMDAGAELITPEPPSVFAPRSAGAEGEGEK